MRNYDANDNESYSFDIGYSSLSTSMMTYGGHRFLGVFNTPDGTGTQYFDANGRLMEGIVLGENDRLYMCWEEIGYTVEFWNDGDRIGMVEDIKFGADMAGYFDEYSYVIFDDGETEFKGWAFKYNSQNIYVTDKNGNLLDGFEEFGSKYESNDSTIRLYAMFGEKTYTVTLHYEDDTDTLEVAFGETLEGKLPIPTGTASKEFKGWSYTDSKTYPKYYNNESITKDTDLYAIFIGYTDVPIKNADGDTIGYVRVSDSGEYVNLPRNYDGTEENENIIIEGLDRGYGISNWYSNRLMSGGYTISSINYDLIKQLPDNALYVDISAIRYTITFDVGNDVQIQSVEMNYTVEEDAELPKATKTNYVFEGWCTDEECTSAVLTKIEKGTQTGNLTLYPKFRGKDITFKLHWQNDTETTTSRTREYGEESYTLTPPNYDGYLFLGWFDSPMGGTKITDDQGKSLGKLTFTEDTDLYAHWAKKYTVTVKIEPKVCEVEVKDYYLENDSVKLSFEMPTGYTFDGWFEDEDPTVKSKNTEYSFNMPNHDVKLTAKFTAKTYQVSFSASTQGEFNGDPVTVTFGEPFELPVVEKANSQFIGWHYNRVFLTDDQGKGKDVWNIDDNITVEALLVEEGTAAGTMIYDVTTFQKIKDAPNAAYTIVFDVDMSGVEWTPFAFGGTLDGGGFKVSNLTVESDKIASLGIFTEVTGTIKNLTFENLNVTSTYSDYVNYYVIGGICGTLSRNGTLSGIKIESGKIDGTNDHNGVGGLVGMLSGKMESCENHAEVVGHSDHGTGGMVARCDSVNITNCTNYGKVVGASNVGGIVGYMAFGVNGVTISGLNNQGEITGKDYVGGVFGQIRNSANIGYSDATWTMTLANLTNTGKITGDNLVGGIWGYLYAALGASGSHSGSFLVTAKNKIENSGDITGQGRVGGIAGEAYTNDGRSCITATSSGKITCSGSKIGGIAGRLENIDLTDCDNSGTTIEATGYTLDGTTYLAYIGGYVGEGYAVTNCTNSSDIIYHHRGAYVGGIAGLAHRVLTNCTNNATINAAESDHVGGLAGRIWLAFTASLTKLTNTGAVTGTNYVGGIWGSLENSGNIGYSDAVYTMTLGNLKNSANITGSGSYVGGIAGHMNAYLSASGSHGASFIITGTQLGNTGNITADGYVGGLVGYGAANNASSSLNGTSSGTITGRWMIGGIAGQLSLIKLSECSNEDTTINATGFNLNGTEREAYVGGYAGLGYAFDKCDNAVSISYTQQGKWVGGIAGYANGVITNCSNTAPVRASGSNFVGGIAGYISLGNTCTLTTLTNDGNVEGLGYVGGIAGYLNAYVHYGYSDGTSTLTLQQFTNSGSVSGNNNVGGLVGHLKAWTDNSGSHSSVYVVIASNMKNTGAIKGVGSSAETPLQYIGGLIGWFESDGASTLMIYTQSGKITAPDAVNSGDIVGAQTNLTIQK